MVGACIQALALPSCSSQTRSAVLTILESLLDSPLSTLCTTLLSPHTDVLARALQALIAAAWSKGGAKGKKAATDKLPAAGRHAAMRGLAVLERVVSGIGAHSDAAGRLTEALLVPLQQLASSTRSVSQTLSGMTAFVYINPKNVQGQLLWRASQPHEIVSDGSSRCK